MSVMSISRQEVTYLDLDSDIVYFCNSITELEVETVNVEVVF